MAALSSPYEAFERPGLVHGYPVGDRPIFKGALVGIDRIGRALPLSPAEPLRFVGIAMETVDPTTPYQKSLQIAKLGSYVMQASEGWIPNLNDLGRVVYAWSDWEVHPLAIGLANPVAVGTVLSIENTSRGTRGVRIRIDLHTV